ncbi:MAG: thiamine biosynthesis protein ThiF [Chloroflexi bacterium RBG_16_64_32]|nr:MAG: thiamine biosynthesis protein ThiF [Chloroflexi bacterium RBG_16_64_32]
MPASAILRWRGSDVCWEENREMSVTVYIPTPFRRLAGNQVYVQAEGSNVAEVLADLSSKYPGLRHMIFGEADEVAGHVNIYVNNQEIHSLQGKETPVEDGDEVAVIPAIAGGQVLTEEQVNRYSRHIIMPQVGPLGQRKLMAAKVLIIGAGGLGSPSALYLALAGVGTIGIADFDIVDLSNLQRQVLHHNDDVGRPKTQSAKDTLLSYNPDVNVVIHDGPLTSENATEIISQYDMVINGADNFTTRYLVNDATYFAGKPLVDGSVLLFDGQATVFIPGKGCYRCLFPAPPPPGLVPSCAEAGVLGALTGVVGSIQAIEALKLILKIGESLASRLLLFDALSMEFRVVKLRRDPKCPLCGDDATIHDLIDYEGFCGAPFPGQNGD